MSDTQTQSTGRVSPVSPAPAPQPVGAERWSGSAGSAAPRSQGYETAAVITDGNLPKAYAQLVVNQDTHDVVIRIRDAATDRIIDEYPSEHVEELAKYMKQYAETLARHHAATRSHFAD